MPVSPACYWKFFQRWTVSHHGVYCQITEVEEARHLMQQALQQTVHFSWVLSLQGSEVNVSNK